MAGTVVLDDVELREAQRDYLDFLDDEEDQGIYQSKVRELISDNQYRLIVNVNDLRRKNEKRANRLLSNAFEELVAFQRALKDFVASIDATYAKQYEEFYIGLEGSFGSKHVSPRTLTSCFLSCVVCVEGIVTKCSLVRPKVVRSVHYCPATKKTIERRYSDLTNLVAFPSSSVYPTKDEENNPLETEYGLSVYKDHQIITIQEMPEKAPAGQLPRSVDVILDDDLVDRVKPGDRVQVVGTYRCLPGKKGGYTSGTFRILEWVAMPSSRMSSQPWDRTPACLMSPALAGGFFTTSASILITLESPLPRPITGDPSVAKSQLLRYVLCTAPRAIPTTGRGSSGVGLTAAVTTDQETGERRLEAGAMVLADRGVVCIDEFDKMSDMDRTAIHEVMEQGRVTIAKAGIHARLNARCSVLAAANPVYGRYDQYKTPMENIGLQDSLLSRFDLLFIMLDQMDPEQDREISDHVLRMHRYRAPGEQDGDAMPLGSAVDILATDDPNFTSDDQQDTQIYEKHDNLLHGVKKKKEKMVSAAFMRKYIHVAKIIKPVLTQESAAYIAEEYSRLRSQDSMSSDTARTSPVTARTLETLIRLATAHAKARMSKTVDLQDAEEAVELVQYAYFKKVLEKEKKRKKPSEDESDAEDEVEKSQEDQEQKMKRRRTSPSDAKEGDSYDPYDFTNTEEEMPQVHTPKATDSQETKESQKVELSESRLKAFKAALLEVFQEAHAQSVGMNRLTESVNRDNEEPFSAAEIQAALSRMQDDNQVMVSEGIVFLI
uniref:DNA replication licensing factor MCM3 n=1 Tax=Capra hircus TaxID=9925 RepID=A0A8C2PH73_CAPHI